MAKKETQKPPEVKKPQSTIGLKGSCGCGCVPPMKSK